LSAGSKFVSTLAISPIKKAVMTMPESMMRKPRNDSPNVMLSLSPPMALAAHSKAATYSNQSPFFR
jgi:hypothetical protein